MSTMQDEPRDTSEPCECEATAAGTPLGPAVAELCTRLRRTEGQIRGLQRMLAEGRPCEDVLTQLLAARNSLEMAGLLLIDAHIATCIAGAGGIDPQKLRDLQYALRMWSRFAATPSSES